MLCATARYSGFVPARDRIVSSAFGWSWWKIRVFVRSWSLKPRSWYRTFLAEPRGTINVDGREIEVRAVHTRSERLKKAVDEAYLEKYHTPGSVKYARDLGRKKSRDTTTELVPV